MIGIAHRVVFGLFWTGQCNGAQLCGRIEFIETRNLAGGGTPPVQWIRSREVGQVETGPDLETVLVPRWELFPPQPLGDVSLREICRPFGAEKNMINPPVKVCN